MNNNYIARQFWWHLLLFAMLLPLLFINRHDWHNWGSDFSQYIAQAKNILQGLPQQQTGYIFTSYRADLPPAYPVGFPLLLAPVYSIFGLDMKALTLFMSMLTIAAGFSVFIFLKREFSPLWSLMATIVMMYAPWTVDFKEQVLSDVPFLIFFLTGFLLVNKKMLTLPMVLTAGFVIGIMFSVRVAGVAFLAAITVKAVSDLWLKKIAGREFANQITVVVIAAGVYFLLNRVLFPITVASSYSDPFDGLSFHLQRNLELNFRYLKDFLAGKEDSSAWGELFAYIPISLAAAGIFFRLRKKAWGLMECCILFYAALLSVLPWYAGFRYLLPVFPFFLVYLLSGIEGVANLFKVRAWYILFPLATAFVILFTPEIRNLHRQRNQPRWSPYEIASREAFHFIKDSLPVGTLVMFEKPRALALFTGCQSLAFPSNPADAESLLQRYKVEYFAQHVDLYHQDYLDFLGHYKEKERIWENEKCVIYKNLAVVEIPH